MSLPYFTNIDGTKSLFFSRGISPPAIPKLDLNQVELTTTDGSDHAQNIGPFRFNYYTLNWGLLDYDEFLLLQDWYTIVCNGKGTKFIYHTPYGNAVTVSFHDFGSFSEVSANCVSGTITLKEKVLR